MKVQRVRIPNTDRVTWLVVDNNYLPVQPISEYLRYLENIERAPNTVHAYAGHLKLYWEFLTDAKLDWLEVSLEHLATFMHWLRCPEPKVIAIQQVKAKRTEKTINAILSAVSSFYEFQSRNGVTTRIDAYRYQFQPGKKYKPFLHHLSKGKYVRTRLLKLKEPKRFPGVMTPEQIKQLVAACQRTRDKFLICLLHESGMRIGEVLGLHHEDIHTSGQNEISVIFRDDNTNAARTKSRESRVIHVSRELMTLYSDYLINEYPESIDSNYVFVNIWEGKLGSPMTYSTVASLFTRLEKKTGIDARPHLFRHTHATDLIRNGWDMAQVQKRLGHANIQTTINTYTHLTNEDLKKAYQQYLEQRDK
ncbi:tyrosine-type recombinase/integrase [Iningainema tapete]|uniref:Tyrosine-type recombinase/integrase n=1 Tax=Iningainema tapete BLCC-T55 TaxID=2748662 RepID=A0A8J6XRJ4_9CYAN|nr:tyrosine-type recombinase/integrase [Iningainema tapete]MBD2777070.1 tyrosine-type recombinase/integrase [Iningainema tapete BLCC-T55]